jgi:rhodanese-related sulfurtransferase
MKQVEKNEILKLIDDKEDFVLVNALRPDGFAKVHIPESINLPIRLEGFDKLALENIPQKDKKVIVYCAGPG